jgi:hypothetical protein
MFSLVPGDVLSFANPTPGHNRVFDRRMVCLPIHIVC